MTATEHWNVEITKLPVCLHVCPPFNCFNKVSDFHEIWRGRYAIRGHPNILLQLFIAVEKGRPTEKLQDLIQRWCEG
jgi:hypothetical protein